MRGQVLNRYERAADGAIIIDVTAKSIEALYNDFDRSAPYIRRDLDQELTDYLIECAREVGPERFSIRFTIAQSATDGAVSRIRRSVNIYFLYLAEIVRQDIRRMIYKAMVLFGIGLAILFISVWVNRFLGVDRSVVANVFAEGLTVAAWVSLWEALATLMIEWPPRRRETRLYRRLAHAALLFRFQSPSVSMAAETESLLG